MARVIFSKGAPGHTNGKIKSQGRLMLLTTCNITCVPTCNANGTFQYEGVGIKLFRGCCESQRSLCVQVANRKGLKTNVAFFTTKIYLINNYIFKMNCKSINLHNNVLNLIFLSSDLGHTKTRTFFIYNTTCVYQHFVTSAWSSLFTHYEIYWDTKRQGYTFEKIIKYFLDLVLKILPIWSLIMHIFFMLKFGFRTILTNWPRNQTSMVSLTIS